MTRISRRRFLGQGARAAAAGVAVPWFVSARVSGANDRIGVGFVGLGARGKQILEHLPDDAEVAAVCDVDARRVGPVAEATRAASYADHRALLDDPNVGAVVIATPDHWHAIQAIDACRAGRDVFCEKPLSLTVREGRAMVDAAARFNTMFQVGPQQRSIPAAIRACEFVRAGRIGAIREVRVINNRTSRDCDLPGEPVPEGLDWSTWQGPAQPRAFHAKIYNASRQPGGYGWMAFTSWSGGMMTSWGTHEIDLVQWALGMDRSGPSEIKPLGQGLTCPLEYTYPNGIVVRFGDGPQGGAVFVGAEGTVTVVEGVATYDPPELGARAPANDPALFRGAAAPIHTRQWLQCVRDRHGLTCDAETGHRTATACHLGNIARRLGRPLRWDPAGETFVGDDEADAMLSREMAAPWRLPDNL